MKLEYINEGRSGYVVYSSGKIRFRMYFEFGGGNCVASINVPTPAEWFGATGIPSNERDKTLTYIAEQVVNDQARGGSYKISDGFIEIFEKA